MLYLFRLAHLPGIRHALCAASGRSVARVCLIGNLIYARTRLRCQRYCAATVIRLNFKLDFSAVPYGKWNSHVGRASTLSISHLPQCARAQLPCFCCFHLGGCFRLSTNCRIILIIPHIYFAQKLAATPLANQSSAHFEHTKLKCLERPTNFSPDRVSLRLHKVENRARIGHNLQQNE